MSQNKDELTTRERNCLVKQLSSEAETLFFERNQLSVDICALEYQKKYATNSEEITVVDKLIADAKEQIEIKENLRDAKVKLCSDLNAKNLEDLRRRQQEVEYVMEQRRLELERAEQQKSASFSPT